MCTCARHSVKYSIGYNTKLHSTHFIYYTHMVSSCKVHRHNRDGKDAQLLVSIGHVTVNQSDPLKAHKIMQYTVHKLAFSVIKFTRANLLEQCLVPLNNDWCWCPHGISRAGSRREGVGG